MPLLAHGNYPNNGDVVLLSTVLPWHNDFLVRLPITFFLADDGGRGLRRRPRAARVARRVRARRRRRRLAARRGHRDDPARAARLAHVDDVRLRRPVPPAPRPLGAPLGPRPRRRRARHRRRHEVVRRQLGRGRRGDLGSRRALVARRGRPAAHRRGRCATASCSAGSRCSAPCPGSRATSLLSDNPVFPLNVAPFGLTIFDAPPDVIRDQAGFAIADYAGDAGRPAPARRRDRRGARRRADPLRRRRSPSRVLLARRRGRAPDGRVLVLAAAVVALGAALHRHPGHRARPARRPVARPRQHALRRAGAARSPCRSSPGSPGACRAPPASGSRRCSPPPRSAAPTAAMRSPACATLVLAAAGVAALAAAAWLLWRLRARRARARRGRRRGAARRPRRRAPHRGRDQRRALPRHRPRRRHAAARRPGRQAHRPGERLVRRRPVAGLAGLRDADRQRRRVRRRVRRRLPDPLPQRGVLPGRRCATAASTSSSSAAASIRRRRRPSSAGRWTRAGGRSRSARACACSSRPPAP